MIPPLHGGVQVKIHCSGGKSNSFWQEKTGDLIPLKALVNIVKTWFKKSEGGDVSCLLVALYGFKNSWECKNSDRKTQK